MHEQPAAAMNRPATHSYLAFDYGTRRVGVATGNTLTRNAQPLRSVAAVGDARFAVIGRLIDEWQPDALVVGVPFHPDGASHENTERARRFARQLRGRFNLPVHEVDERYTTTEAASNPRAACFQFKDFTNEPLTTALAPSDGERETVATVARAIAASASTNVSLVANINPTPTPMTTTQRTRRVCT